MQTPFVLPYESEVVVIVGVIALLSLLFGIIALAGGARQKRKLKKWKSIHATADLEEVYTKTLHEVGKLRDEMQTLGSRVEQLRAEVQKKVSTANIHRYNAFSETGSDLSFSLALLDGENNGVVLSSIYGRDESRTYAKPVLGGASTYTLTEEEEDVIAGATGRKPLVHGKTR